MSAKVSIILLWPYTAACGNRTTLDVEAGTVLEALRELAAKFPKAGELLLDGEGRPTGRIGLYLNKRDVRLLEDIHTGLKDGDKILILPALSGG